MTFFIVCLFIIVIFSYLAEKRDSPYCMAVVVIALSVLTGFRAESVGIDTANYYDQFKLIANDSAYISIKDIVFNNIAKLFINLSGSYWVLIFFFSSIIALFFILRLWDFRKDASFTLMVVLFLSFHMLASMNIMRQYVAIAIAFYFSRFLFLKKNYALFIFGTLLAGALHFSAMVMFALLPISILLDNKQKDRFIKLILLVVVAIPVVYTIYDGFVERYSSFYLRSGTGSGVGVGLILKILVFIGYFIVDIYGNKANDNSTQAKELTVLCVIGALLCSLGYFFNYANRIGIYFQVFEVPLYGIMIKTHSKIVLKFKKFKLPVWVVPIAVLTVYVVYTSVSGNGHGVFPYKTFWQ